MNGTKLEVDTSLPSRRANIGWNCYITSVFSGVSACPLLGSRAIRGNVATFDFVHFSGNPQEREGWLVIPPNLRPPRR